MIEERGNEIKHRQLITLIVLVIPGIKFLILPSVIAEVSGRDSWIVMAIMFMLDFACIVTILLSFLLNKKHLSFFEILQTTLGKIGAKIVLLFYAVFFFFRTVLSYIGVIQMLEASFCMSTSWVGFMIPVLIVVGYNVLKGFRNITRVTEALVVFFVVAAVVIISLSAGDCELEKLKPILGKGLRPVLDGVDHARFWFGDCVFIIFLLGKCTAKKGFLLHGSIAFWFGAICMTVFTAVFLSLYGELAQFNENALAKISGLSMRVSSEGRLDWLLLILWLSEVIIKSAIFLYVATVSVREIIGASGNKSNFAVLSVLSLLVLVLPLFIDFRGFNLKYVVNGWGNYFLLVPIYIVPLAVPLLTWISNKRQQNKNSTSQEVVDPQRNLELLDLGKNGAEEV